MNIDEFEIGKIFYGSAGFKWLCTDKGTRTINAIRIDEDKDPVWFFGPPYAIEEEVFDENEMKKCIAPDSGSYLIQTLIDRYDNMNESCHPGFDSKDVFIMMEKDNIPSRKDYPRKKILTVDRVGEDGSIYHPYAAIKKENVWYIKVFEIFTKTYSEIDEDIFVRYQLSNELAMRKRVNSLKNV